MSRQNQKLVYVSLELTPGVWTRIPDPFDKRTGGDVDSSETKYKPGGMLPERALGGTATVGNVTVDRLYDVARDHDLIRRCRGRVGKAGMRVTEVPIDADGVPLSVEPTVRTGVLKTVNEPDYDSNSESAAVWSLVCSTHGTVG